MHEIFSIFDEIISFAADLATVQHGSAPADDSCTSFGVILTTVGRLVPGKKRSMAVDLGKCWRIPYGSVGTEYNRNVRHSRIASRPRSNHSRNGALGMLPERRDVGANPLRTAIA
jgi:hypothetical protein